MIAWQIDAFEKEFEDPENEVVSRPAFSSVYEIFTMFHLVCPS